MSKEDLKQAAWSPCKLCLGQLINKGMGRSRERASILQTFPSVCCNVEPFSGSFEITIITLKMFEHWSFQKIPCERPKFYRIEARKATSLFISTEFAPTDLPSAMAAVKRLLPVLVSERRRRPRRGRPVVEPGRRRTRLERPRRHVPGVGENGSEFTQILRVDTL